MNNTPGYELAVIIPALNEATSLPALITALGKQQNIHFEIIVADGGSSDETLAACRLTAEAAQVPFQGVSTPAGRAKQMNAGSRHAHADDLLFLHADTTIDNPRLLADAKAAMERVRKTRGDDDVAGHFGLYFIRNNHHHDAGYYFFEAKTRLNRRDCINGDQGFWLSQRYLQQLGGFDESLNFMEDARLAHKIFDHGHWVTLPGSVGTSARRFETEGLKQRQTLNAIICNFDRIGFHAFFDAAQSAYRQQEKTDALNLIPFLKIIHRLSFAEGLKQGARYWFDTGSYVAENCWQLAFQRDCRRNQAAGRSPGTGTFKTLETYDKQIAPLINSPPARVMTALLTLLWFYGLLAVLLFKSA